MSKSAWVIVGCLAVTPITGLITLVVLLRLESGDRAHPGSLNPQPVTLPPPPEPPPVPSLTEVGRRHTPGPPTGLHVWTLRAFRVREVTARLVTVADGQVRSTTEVPYDLGVAGDGGSAIDGRVELRIDRDTREPRAVLKLEFSGHEPRGGRPKEVAVTLDDGSRLMSELSGWSDTARALASGQTHGLFGVMYRRASDRRPDRFFPPFREASPPSVDEAIPLAVDGRTVLLLQLEWKP